MKMMGSSPKGPIGNLSALEKALSKKQKPMKPAAPRAKAEADIKGALKQAVK